MTVADQLRVEHRRAPRATKAPPAANAPRARSIASPRSRAAAPPPPAATSAVTPEACAASVSLRLATRSSCRVSPQTSSTTAPSASQASASAAVRNAVSTSARAHRHHQARIEAEFGTARSSTARRIRVRKNPAAPRPAAAVRATRPARPAMKPVAAALCRPLGEHLVHRAATRARPAASHRPRHGRARPC